MYAVSDDDSQYEDWTEGDEEQSEDETSNNVVASDSLEVDEASFVDSREDVDESGSHDDSID